MEQNKQGNKNWLLTVISVIILGITVLILFVFDVNNAINKSLVIYNDNQNILADVLFKSAVVQAKKDTSDLADTMKLNIKEKYPTSSSMYCIIAKNDEIIYLKDDNTTATLRNEKIRSFFSADNISSKDNQKYIISKAENVYSGEKYTLALCTKQNNLIKKLKLNEMRMHGIGYFILYGTILIVIIALLFYKIRSKGNSIKNLKEEEKNNRLIIEKLEIDKNKNYVNSERDGDYSFYSRTIIDEVINVMSQEEKMKCIQIDIFVENLKMEHFILITAILGRIKVGNSISCYWEENQFKVLLFDSIKEEVQRFIDLFINKYKLESQEKVEELKIVASRLLGGNYEI